MSQVLGEYQLIQKLGQGGMGAVYKALHTKLDRVVALKVLSRQRMEDGRAISRFEREIRALGKFSHPNVVQAFDAREIDGMPVLIMEYVDGLDLAEIVRRTGPLPVAEACELVRRTALGLQRAHEYGLVHRDIKPSNIMLTQSGEVKLLDVGLARFYVGQIANLPHPGQLGNLPPEEITGTGQPMGTADYMAPEQASDSRAVNIRADLYSLGCTLYKLASGCVPFGGREHATALDKMNAHVHEPVPPIRQFVAGVPDGLVAILDRLLAKDPGDRFATPAELAAAIEPLCDGANLADLAARASAIGSEPSQAAGETGEDDEGAPSAGNRDKARASAPIRRRPMIKTFLIGLGFFGATAAAFAAGIVIMMKKNGQTYQIEVPENSHVVVDQNGNATVELPGQNGRAASGSVSTVEADALDGRAANEVVSVAFGLDKREPTEALVEVRKLLGPGGAFTFTCATKSSGAQLTVIDEAGRVRQIRDMLKRIHAPLPFGPVIERVLNAHSEGTGNDAIDLASGKLVDLPKEFDHWSAQQQSQWSTDHNVDLMSPRPIADPIVEGNLTQELTPLGLKLAAIGNERWENVTHEDLQLTLASVTPGCVLTSDGRLQPVATLYEMRGITSYILSSGFTQPLTFAFQTRKGDLGLLQVIRYTLEPLGVRVRYKLVQPSAALAVPSPSAVAEEKASQGASAINPAAELKALQGEWKMVRIEKGKDADVSWPRIYRGSPIDPATPVRFHFGGSYRSEDLFIRCFDPNGRPSWTGRYFTYHINPTVTPKTIDLFRRLFGGPGSSEASPEPAAIGIYEIAGDQLRIHLTERQPALQEDVQRPKAFRIESDSGDILFVLERRRPSEDLRAFLGKWALIAQFEDGRPLADDKLRRREYLFSELSISVLEKTDYATLDDVLQGEFVLDAARHPKRITITSYYDFSNKKSEKRELLGIYEIGGDRLRIAYRPGGAPPETFESHLGSGVTLLELRRLNEPSVQSPGAKQNVAPKPPGAGAAPSSAPGTPLPPDGHPQGKPDADAAQLRVYSPAGVSPDSALRVLQAVAGGMRDVRVTLDTKTGALVVLARPSQHSVIGAVLVALRSNSGNTTTKSAAAKPVGKIRFQFRFQPWKDVLKWLAQQADLSLVTDTWPTGTFNYSDDREYTPDEAIDLVKSVLEENGYMLVRNRGLLMVTKLKGKRSDAPAASPGVPQTPAPATVPEVAVTHPVVRQLTHHVNFPGRVEALQTAVVRANVAGPVTKVFVTLGAMVKQGDVLFEIDPAPFQAAVEKCRAEAGVAKVRLDQATTEFKEAKAPSPGVRRHMAEAEGAWTVAQAALKAASLNLESTRVTAPIRGKIARLQVAVGSHVNQVLNLATIDSLDPVSVAFDVRPAHDPRTPSLRQGRVGAESPRSVARRKGLHPRDQGGVGRRANRSVRRAPRGGARRCRTRTDS